MSENTELRRVPPAQWQDWVILVVGAWLFVSPWLIYGPVTADAVDWNSWIVGAALVLLALAAILRFHEWEEWVSGAIGVWLVISPWVLRFADMVPARWNAVICGLIVLAMAAEELWEIRHPRRTQA